MRLQKAFTAAALGNNTIIAGDPTNNVIQIIEIVFQVSAVTSIQLKAGSAALTGAMAFATGGGFQLPNNGQGAHFEIDGGADFILNMAGVLASVGGFVVYDQFAATP